MVRSRGRYVRCQAALVLNEASVLLAESRGAGTMTSCHQIIFDFRLPEATFPHELQRN